MSRIFHSVISASTLCLYARSWVTDCGAGGFGVGGHAEMRGRRNVNLGGEGKKRGGGKWRWKCVGRMFDIF